jgi:phosphoribosylformimino-5-aminoimidazole carboxamide ribotide isomerase
MIIIPAIDLYGGKVVRLRKGDFSDKTEYGADPFDAAKKFHDMGSGYLHIVDLEGAEAGYPKHLDVLSKITNRLEMKVEYGGGLRTHNAIRDADRAGADRLMVGSIIFRTPDAPRELFEAFGTILTPSVDVRGGQVVVAGWKKETRADPAATIRNLREIGYTAFLVTAVDRDGMLEGPDFALYRDIHCEDAYVIAAGGVTTTGDVKKLAEIGVRAAVVGKAIYEGRFDFPSALRALKDGAER